LLISSLFLLVSISFFSLSLSFCLSTFSDLSFPWFFVFLSPPPSPLTHFLHPLQIFYPIDFLCLSSFYSVFTLSIFLLFTFLSTPFPLLVPSLSLSLSINLLLSLSLSSCLSSSLRLSIHIPLSSAYLFVSYTQSPFLFSTFIHSLFLCHSSSIFIICSSYFSLFSLSLFVSFFALFMTQN
jgi:hypothetical protein